MEAGPRCRRDTLSCRAIPHSATACLRKRDRSFLVDYRPFSRRLSDTWLSWLPHGSCPPGLLAVLLTSSATQPRLPSHTLSRTVLPVAPKISRPYLVAWMSLPTTVLFLASESVPG